MQRVGWELFLEFTEYPINSTFIHMFPPSPDGYDPLFRLKIYGEALWKWRELKNEWDVSVLVTCKILEDVSNALTLRTISLLN